MIRTSSFSGDTWLSYHFPGVQLPPWQLQTLCPPRPGPPGRPGPCSAGQLTRAVSLPEQDVLRREPPVALGNQRRLVSSSHCSLKEDRAEEEEEEEEEASDSSGRLDTSSSGEDGPQQVLKPRSTREQSASRPRSHNSFLPSAELDEEEEDSDGDNLHRYHEDSSFMLHGNFNWAVSKTGGALEKKPLVLDTESSAEQLAGQPGRLHSLPTDCLEVRESSGLFLDSTVQDLNKISDFNFGQPTCTDSFPVHHTESTGDSSCNSSDGILVNFCTIYSESNDPAAPQDPPGSLAPLQPAHVHDGSVFLNLRPVRPRSPSEQHEVPSTQEELEMAEVAVPSAPRWSPPALDSNCNLYSLETWSSLELSDLTACLQGQLTLAMATNQKYYKLVSCDLPSKSPSPAWPGLARGCPEGLQRLSLVPTCDSIRDQMERKERDKQNQDGSRYSPAQSGVGCNHQYDAPLCTTTTHEEVYTQSPPSASTGPSPIRASLPLGTTATVAGSHDVQPVPTQPSVKWQHGQRSVAEENGACSWAPPAVRYSKAQRPTSLPIQPFVLLPLPEPQSQALGSLLDQYISSQPGSQCKAKGNRLFTHLTPSPRDSYGRILLQAASSSDTCSTCSPSPQRFSQRLSGNPSSPCSSHTVTHLTHTSPTPRMTQTQGPYSGSTQSDYMFKLSSNKPSPRSYITPQIRPSLPVDTPTSHFLIDLTPELTPGPWPRSTLKPQTPDFTEPGSSHSTPPTLSCTSLPQQPAPLGVISAAPHRDPRGSWFPRDDLSEAFSSRGGSLLSVTGPGGVKKDSAGGGKKQNQTEPCESDGPPTEFCLSPCEASYESLSISHLQRRGLLRSVSAAMDLIMAHFGSSRDPEEKMRLGNSWRSPTIAGLVLEHLCPAVQNLLEDGLRHHKLDVVIGQQRNHSWSVVEASTQKGRATRVLDNLVSKIHLCPLLTSSCMKLRAFIMGLLK
ncbi:unnamed protein product [Merluccius merluccius]